MKKNISTTTERNTRFIHHSDGSELIPSEISSPAESEPPLASGYTIDDEGILNTYAVEPKMSAASYPSRKQQFHYFLWGVAAIILVVALLGIASAVS